MEAKTIGRIERRIAIFTNDNAEFVQESVNAFLAELPSAARGMARITLSTSVWDSEAVLTTTVMVDYEVA